MCENVVYLLHDFLLICNLLTIVNKFSNAGYHNKFKANKGEIELLILIKLITKNAMNVAIK